MKADTCTKACGDCADEPPKSAKCREDDESVARRVLASLARVRGPRAASPTLAPTAPIWRQSAAKRASTSSARPPARRSRRRRPTPRSSSTPPSAASTPTSAGRSSRTPSAASRRRTPRAPRRCSRRDATSRRARACATLGCRARGGRARASSPTPRRLRASTIARAISARRGRASCSPSMVDDGRGARRDAARAAKLRAKAELLEKPAPRPAVDRRRARAERSAVPQEPGRVALPRRRRWPRRTPTP